MVKRNPTHRLSSVAAGGLFALFVGLLIQALTIFGVLTVITGHIFMFLAFLVGALIIATEMLPLKPARHKVVSIALLLFVLVTIDVLCAVYGPRPSPCVDINAATTQLGSQNLQERLAGIE